MSISSMSFCPTSPAYSVAGLPVEGEPEGIPESVGEDLVQSLAADEGVVGGDAVRPVGRVGAKRIDPEDRPEDGFVNS